ncbi:head-tail adaptor protein [Mycobacterium kyogaense]|uniref:phage head completion protein n=1 Tax=Mycobacterium kyogaense TaxID=2212479 RepID=UPI000DAEC812|nr:hypothetical protein [Mycobacterium kyogaense]
MSLLNRGTDTVTVYPEVVGKDSDGNERTKASAQGTECRAVVQPMTSTEKQDVGFNSVEILRLRLVGWQGGLLGAQSQVEWQGRRYSVVGEARQHRGSRRTAHTVYTVTRS